MRAVSILQRLTLSNKTLTLKMGKPCLIGASACIFAHASEISVELLRKWILEGKAIFRVLEL